MNCEKYREMISAVLDGELSSSEETALESHLRECAKCREFQRSLQELHDLGLQRQPARMPGRVEHRISASLPRRGARAGSLRDLLSGHYRVPRSLVWVGLAMMMFLLADSVIGVFRERPEQRHSEEPVPNEMYTQRIVLTESDIYKVYTVSQSHQSDKGDL